MCFGCMSTTQERFFPGRILKTHVITRHSTSYHTVLPSHHMSCISHQESLSLPFVRASISSKNTLTTAKKHTSLYPSTEYVARLLILCPPSVTSRDRNDSDRGQTSTTLSLSSMPPCESSLSRGVVRYNTQSSPIQRYCMRSCSGILMRFS